MFPGIQPMGLCDPWETLFNSWTLNRLSTGVDNRLMVIFWTEPQWVLTMGWLLSYGMTLKNCWNLVWISIIICDSMKRGSVLLLFEKLECPCQNKFEFSEFQNIPQFHFSVFVGALYHIWDSQGCDSVVTQMMWLR